MINAPKLNLFNPAALTELLEIESDEKEGLVGALIIDYIAKAPQLLSSLQESCFTMNKAQIEINLHSLKSSSALLGLEQLAFSAGHLEDRVGQLLPQKSELGALELEVESAVFALKNFKSTLK